MGAKPTVVKLPWSCEFRVVGLPEPKGSPRVLRLASGRTILTVRTLRGERWERHVAQIAAQHAPPTPIDGPVAVRLAFAMRSPKRPRCAIPDTRPDLDKLVRAVLDALGRAQIYVDDSRVQSLVAEKRWAERMELPGVLIAAAAL